jgi:hypothetical protein
VKRETCRIGIRPKLLNEALAAGLVLNDDLVWLPLRVLVTDGALEVGKLDFLAPDVEHVHALTRNPHRQQTE